MLTGCVLGGGIDVVEDAVGDTGTVVDVVDFGAIAGVDDWALEHPAAVQAMARLAAARNAVRRTF